MWFYSNLEFKFPIYPLVSISVSSQVHNHNLTPRYPDYSLSIVDSYFFPFVMKCIR